jgi:hypothetical protein
VTDRFERVPSLRALMLRWQLAGMLVGFALALLAAVLDARRNGPLSLQGNVLPMARLIAVGTLASVPISAMLCWGWVAAAQRVVVLEQRALLRSLGLGLVGGLQALSCFAFGALLTGRFAEVWATTDRFAWLPGVPALVLLLWPIMAAWLLVPRVIVPALRRPLVASTLVGLTLLASCTAAGTGGRVVPRVDAPETNDIRTGSPTLAVDERIAILNYVWEERTQIVADGAFIGASALHNVTRVAPGSDQRWSASVRSALWGDERPYNEQPPAPPRMRLWRVQQLSVAQGDVVIVTARLSNAAREHRESFTLAYRDGRWWINSLQIDSWGFY